MLRPMEAGIRGSWHYQFFFFLLRQCYWRSIFFFPKYHWRGGTDFPTTLCLATLPCSDDLCLEKEHCSSQGPFHCSLLHCLYHQEVKVFYFVLPFFTGAVEVSHAQPGLHLPRWARHHLVHSGFCYQPKILQSLIWLCSEILSSDVFSVHMQISSRDNTTKWLLYFVVFSGYC